MASLVTDSSIELFKRLVPLRGHLVSDHSGLPSFEQEVALICRLLFTQFLKATHHVQNASLIFDPDNSVWRIDKKSLDNLTRDILPLYNWSLGQNGNANSHAIASVQPWILDYLYQRWIDNRETGSYFTPDFLAQSIVTHAFHEWLALRAGKNLGDNNRVLLALRCWYARDPNKAQEFKKEFEWISDVLQTVKIVDLSAGGGAFVVSATRHLFDLGIFVHSLARNPVSKAERIALMQRILANNVYGLDLMQEAIAVAKMRLWLLAIELDATDSKSSNPLPVLDNLIQENSLVYFSQFQNHQPTLWSESNDDNHLNQKSKTPIVRDDFDLCVGNPPFIALSQGNHVPGKTAFIDYWNSQHAQYAVKPTSDLSNFFILRGAEILRQDGILAYITSRNFFDTRYGEPIRRFLTEQVELRHIFTLHEHPFIQQGLKVKANTVILSLARCKPQVPIRFHHLVSPEHPLVDVVGQEVSRTELASSSNWTQTLFKDSLLKELIARSERKLSVYAHVRMGTKTGCNTFFLIRLDKLATDLNLPSKVLRKTVKNSRDIEGFVLPNHTPYRLFNLKNSITGIERGYSQPSQLDSIAQYIYSNGIEYPCPECQSLAKKEHHAHPELFPHPGICRKCSVCQKQAKKCDRPVDRLSTQGHSPEWYTLGLKHPLQIAVQCIVDTEIGVFWNESGVYVTDQFQAIESCINDEIAVLVFLYLTSRISHYLLEGTCLHRARYDGSFMLKIQVSHLNELPCPNLDKITPHQKKTLMGLHRKILETGNRKSDQAKKFRDQIDCVFLEMLGYSENEINPMQDRIKADLEKAILFRWTKSKTRHSNQDAEAEEEKE